MLKTDRAYVTTTAFLWLMTYDPKVHSTWWMGKTKEWFCLCPLGFPLLCLRAGLGPGRFACNPCTPPPSSSLALHKFSPTSPHGELCIGQIWQIHKWNWLFRCFGLKGICFHSSSFFCLLPVMLGSKTLGLLRDQRLQELLGGMRAVKAESRSLGARHL